MYLGRAIRGFESNEKTLGLVDLIIDEMMQARRVWSDMHARKHACTLQQGNKQGDSPDRSPPLAKPSMPPRR